MKKKNRKQNGDAQGGGAGWLTTFNDLMTLLMVFFVLLFTMSSIDARKIKDFQDALQSGLGMMLAGKNVSVGVIEPIVKSYSGDNRTAEEVIADLKVDMEDLQSDASTGSENLDEPSDKKEDVKNAEPEPGKEKDKTAPHTINGLLDALEKETDLKVTYSNKETRIILEDKVIFKLAMAEINPEGLQSLEKLSPLIKELKTPVRIEGHTDNLPINTERFPSNWELSATRAVNVVRYFTETVKMAPERFSAAGYGDSKPLYPNDSPGGRAKNRRVEIVMVNAQGK